MPQRIEQQRINNKKYFDKGTRKQNNLHVGDEVYMKRNPEDVWTKGEVRQKLSNRTCIVSSNQKLYQRNTIHVRKPNTTTTKMSSEDERTNLDESQTTSTSQQSLTRQIPTQQFTTDAEDECTSQATGISNQQIKDSVQHYDNSTKRQIRAPRRFEDYEPFQ